MKIFMRPWCLNFIAKIRVCIIFSVVSIDFPDPPGVPQDPAAVEIPSDSPQVRCQILVIWDRPNDINSVDVDHYIVQTSSQGEINAINETATVAAFLSPCKELTSLYINITAVDRCGREGGSTANFKPSIQPPVSTTSSPVPCESINFYSKFLLKKQRFSMNSYAKLLTQASKPIQHAMALC